MGDVHYLISVPKPPEPPPEQEPGERLNSRWQCRPKVPDFPLPEMFYWGRTTEEKIVLVVLYDAIVRKVRGISVQTIAERSGVSKPGIHAILKQLADPEYEIIAYTMGPNDRVYPKFGALLYTLKRGREESEDAP